MATTRTGLFPTEVKRRPEKEVAKNVAKSAMKTRIRPDKTPKASILKRKSTGSTTLEKKQTAGASRQVKFKSKTTEQESLREKLNAWLEAKGKTPSRCRHLMFFNAQVSARKKRKTEDKLVERTITQNLLSDQLETLNKEENETKGKTSNSSQSGIKTRRSVEKENRQTRRGLLFKDELAVSFKDEVPSGSPQNMSSVDVGDLSPVLREDSSCPPQENPESLANLDSLLKECLMLYKAGYPLESLMPCLEDIQTHCPQALTYAPFYICKAKLLSAFPQIVLDVFCQAVRNNAQPSELLAAEMKASMSLLLVPPPPVAPPEGLEVGAGYSSTLSTAGADQSSAARSASTPCTPLSLYASSCAGYTPHRRLADAVNVNNCSGSYVNVNNSGSNVNHSYVNHNYSGSYVNVSNTNCSGSCTSVNNTSGHSPSVSEVCLSHLSSGRLSPSPLTSNCSTPLDRCTTRPVTMTPENADMGSQVHYKISSTTPLLRHVAEASPVAVITPVRRSARLSGRPSTPGSALRREVTSVSNLSQTERRSMLFQTNPAITGGD